MPSLTIIEDEAGGSQLGRGAKLSKVRTIHTQGGLAVTDRLTDLAVQGSGFFIIRNSKVRSRNPADSSIPASAPLTLMKTVFFPMRPAVTCKGLPLIRTAGSSRRSRSDPPEPAVGTRVPRASWSRRRDRRQHLLRRRARGHRPLQRPRPHRRHRPLRAPRAAGRAHECRVARQQRRLRPVVPPVGVQHTLRHRRCRADDRDRRRVRRPAGGGGPRHLPLVLRLARLHNRQRLLPQGQPERGHHVPRRQRRVGGGDLARSRHGQRALQPTATSCSSRRTTTT